MEVRRLVLVGHPAARMFDLIEAVEHYPVFLPWCRSATVTDRSEATVAADIVIEWHGVRLEFSTQNAKRRPEWMNVRLTRGPFRDFAGEWNLTPLGDEGCKVGFLLRYDFENPLLRRVAGPVFERIANTLVDAFVARADDEARAGWPPITGPATSRAAPAHAAWPADAVRDPDSH
jgi:ribosome-associated toxin RatA of RatAB toxin-antitoxin module